MDHCAARCLSSTWNICYLVLWSIDTSCGALWCSSILMVAFVVEFICCHRSWIMVSIICCCVSWSVVSFNLLQRLVERFRATQPPKLRLCLLRHFGFDIMSSRLEAGTILTHSGSSASPPPPPTSSHGPISFTYPPHLGFHYILTTRSGQASCLGT